MVDLQHPFSFTSKTSRRLDYKVLKFFSLTQGQINFAFEIAIVYVPCLMPLAVS